MNQIDEYLAKIERVIEAGTYKDDWKSLSRYQVPDWYRNDKFGIFIHWGVYSVPAFENEWYPRNMYIKGSLAYKHHLKTYGEPKNFGYKDFIPMFRAEKFDAEEWVKLFKASGAKFVMPVGEHHDGFQMYDSALSDWCVSKMGPKKDTLGLLKKAVEKENLKLCVSSHRAEHTWFLSGSTEFDSGVDNNIAYGDLFWPNRPAGSQETEPIWSHQTELYSPQKDFLDDWLVRTCEMVDKYQPKMVFFDWWIHNAGFKPYLKKFAAYYYNRAEEWKTGVVINYKYDAFHLNTAVLDIERGQMDHIYPAPWQCDTSVAKNSWCYTEGNNYKKTQDIICDFVDIISKNGTMLLNIGPKADGSIPEQDKQILLEIGEWMNINAEAIYATTPWKIFGEGPTKVAEGAFTDTKRESFTPEDIRFTCKDGILYAFVLKVPNDGVVKIKSLRKYSPDFNTFIERVTMLGSSHEVLFKQNEDALTLCIGEFRSNYPICFRIQYQ